MRRLQYDAPSQAVRNLITNPELVADVSDKLLFKNAISNPSFEVASGTATVRTNLSTNPAFESTSGTVTVRQNLATNPAFEATSGTPTVRTNLFTHPNFELSSGTTNAHVNYSTNPGMETAGSAVVVRTNLAPNPQAVFGPGWFGANGVTATGTTGVTGGPPGFSKMARLTVTGTATGMNYFAMAYGQSPTTGAAVTAGNTYTASLWVRVTMANYTQQPGMRLRWKTSAGVTISDAPFVAAVGAVNGKWVRLSSTALAPANAAYIEVMGGYTSIDQSTISIGDTVEVTGVLIEQSTLVGDYFDGTTPASARINLQPDSSFETDVGQWINNGPGTMAQDSTRAYVGTKSLKIVPGQENWGYHNPMSSGLVLPGQTYTFSVWVYSDAAQTLCLTNYNTPVLGPSVNVPAGVWTRLHLTQTIPSNATNVWISVRNPDRVTIPTTFYLDAYMIEPGSTLGSYFDGNTATANGHSHAFTGTANNSASVARNDDFTYAFTGTANDSPSEQRGVTVSGRTGLPPNGQSWQSSVRSRSGTKSAAVLIKSALADNASVWYPAGDITVGTGAGQVPANTVITWSVYVYIPSGSGAKVGLMEVTTGIRGTPSATLYNQWQRISLTMTTPATGTFFLRMRTWGDNPAGSTLWIDEEMIEASQQPTRYFDGANPLQNLCVNPSFATGITNYTSISASLARITTMGDGHVGELTQTIANAARQGAIYLSPTILNEETYTVSFDVQGTAAEFTNVRCFLYDNASATIVSQTPTPTIPLIKDGNFNRYVFNLTATASFDRIYLEVLGTNIPIGAKSWIDRVLIEKGTTATSPYYEGQGDFAYAWTGAANASSSVKTASNLSGWTSGAPIYRSALAPKMGTYCGAVETRGLNGDGLWQVTPNLDVLAGRTYSYSAWVRTTTAHALTVGFRWTDAGSVQIGADTNVVVTSSLTVGSWSLVTATAVAPANAVKLQLMLRIYESHTPTTFYVDGAICAESMTPVSYFDGATAASGDYTYAWSGTANASTSLQRVVGVADTSTGSVAPASSSEWKGLGTKSLRLIPYVTHTWDTFTSIGGDTGALRLGMQAGKTYTISATIRLAAAQTGSLSSRARKIVLFYKSPEDQFHAEVPSNQAANAAGETRVSLTVTLPATANEAFIRLYNGASAGNGDVWWDNLLIEESSYLRPYFDGATPAQENLVTLPATANSGATTHTPNVSYAGSTWTRSTTAANGVPLTRQYVDAALLRAGETYTASVTLANDQAFSQTVSFDWCDVGSVSHTLAPGEIKRITTSGFRPATGQYVYGSTYRFSDLHVQMSTTEDRSILFKDWLIELGTTSGEYYAGTGDLTYNWAGTANASVSRQVGTAVATFGGANNAACYRTGSAGNYKGRVVFTTGQIADSGLTFGTTASLGASKYFTVAVDMTSDTTRTVKFSAQGSGANMLNSANITLTAGVKARHSFTFSTTATAPASVSLYVLRTDLLPGTIDFDNMVIEEGLSAGPYFDGTNHIKNLVDNPTVDANSTGWYTNDSTLYPAVRSTVSPIRGTASFVSTRSATTLNTTAASIYVNGKDPSTITSLKVSPGDVISASLDVKVSQPNRRVTTYLVFRTASSVSLGNFGTTIVNVTSGVTTRVGSAGVVAPANADSVILVANVSSVDGSNVVSGEQVWFDGLLIEKSATINDYYAGTGDFTFAWTGTANASTSTMIAPMPSGYVANLAGRVSWQSSTGPVDGKKSIAVLGGSPNVDSFVEVPTPFAGETLGGRTFTILATRKTMEALPASGNDSRAWKPLWQAVKSGGGYQQVLPPIGPTTAGVHKFKHTFTFDADVTTSFFMRLYNGSATGGSVVWWDDFAIIEGAYPGDYFDGDTTDTADYTYLWDGTVGTSSSSMRAYNVKGTWFEQRAKISSSADKPFSGSHKVKASVTQVGYFPRMVSNTFTPVPGRRYTAFAKMKCSTQPVQIALKWIAAPDIYPAAPSQSASNGNWTKVSTSEICPPLATHVQIFAGLPDNAPLNTEFEIDSILLTDRAYEGPFGSGDTYGWQWEGTPHASSSKGYPVGLTQLAGKPLFVGALPGQYVLTDIDPANNPVIPAGAPRTIYSIVDNLIPLASGALDSVFVYGVDSLNDTVANTTIIGRQQSQSGNLTNAYNARRTGGGGPITLNVPASGKQVLIAGINENGNMFSAVNKSALVVDTPSIIMSVPHERIRIEPDSIYHKHVVTYIYPGVHSSALRAEMVRLLGDHYNIPGIG